MIPVHILHGRPVTLPVLGAYLHLDRLEEAHAEQLAAAVEQVWDWQGKTYSTAELSASGIREQARRVHLDYVVGCAESVATKKAELPFVQKIYNVDAKLLRDDYYVDLRDEPSIYAAPQNSFEFWMNIGKVDETMTALPCYASLFLSVSPDTPLDEFEERITSLAATLPLRWGTAGLTYTWSSHYWREATNAIYAHARRYAGFDTGFYHRSMEYLYDKIRSVNWLNFVGTGFLETHASLQEALQPGNEEGLTTTALANGIKIRAGDRPHNSDANRLAISPLYVRADALLRSGRARDGKRMVFIGPWSEREISNWLSRFERTSP